MDILAELGLRRVQPVRRLSPEDCDALGFMPPLVLAVHQAKGIIGPWRSLDDYDVVQHPNGVVMRCSRAELARHGVDVRPEQD